MHHIGYKKVIRDNKITLDIDYNVSHIVQRIFEEVSLGVSKKELAQNFNSEGISSPMIYLKMTKNKNKNYYDKWTDKIIYRIIRNKTYIGDNVIRKSTKINYKQKKRDYINIRDRETLPNTHQAIIKLDLFDRANNSIKTISRKTNRIKEYDNLLTDLLVCGECGRKMSVQGRKRESGNVHYAFYCVNNISKKTCSNNRKVSDNKLRELIYNTLTCTIKKFVDSDNIVNSATNNLIKKEKINIKIKNLEADIENHNNNIRRLYLQKASRRNQLRKVYV